MATHMRCGRSTTCLLAILGLLITGTALADSFTGKVIGVSDGDTITVLVTNSPNHFAHNHSANLPSSSPSLPSRPSVSLSPVKVRLAEIDTPERHQAFGTQAKKALSRKIFGKTVKVLYETRDRYGRIIGKIYLGDRWVNKEMVEEGFAWHYKYYSKDKELAAAETTARAKKAGLWSHKDPTPPWEFRRTKRTPKKTTVITKSPAPASAGQYWLNTSSGTRHNPSCKYFNNTMRGRSCGANEGTACGICGG